MRTGGLVLIGCRSASANHFDCCQATYRDRYRCAPPRAATYDASVQTELADGLPPIRGDRVRLQQVLLNLIINAIETMSRLDEGPRELLVSTRRAETGRSHLRNLLHREAERNGVVAVDLPFDRRSPRRTVVGQCKRPSWAPPFSSRRRHRAQGDLMGKFRQIIALRPRAVCDTEKRI